VFGRRLSHAGHSHHAEHPLRRRAVLTIIAAAVLAALALLIAPPHAHGNFVYWANEGQTTIGRAKINGTGVNNAFVPGLNDVQGVAIDSKFIYWTQGRGGNSSIGRANLDGSGVNTTFIPASAGVTNFAAMPDVAGIAVNSSGIFWNNTAAVGQIGHSDLNGGNRTGTLVQTGPDVACGIAADESFVYWLDTSLGQSIGRATITGGDRRPSFIMGAASVNACGVAVDPNFVYYGSSTKGIGRAPVGGGTANNAFIPSAVSPSNDVCGVAVNSQYVFWVNSGATDSIGRATLSGNSPNPSFITGPTDPCLPAAAPSNKITVNSITKKKKKGTATINAKVPGPGQVTLNQTSTPPDANATAAAVKQQGLTITAASSFKLAVKPVGKTAKKLNKQLKKKNTAKVKVKVFIHFVPAGVAGVPNTKQVTVALIKQRKKK
jgi:hypothetical protein